MGPKYWDLITRKRSKYKWENCLITNFLNNLISVVFFSLCMPSRCVFVGFQYLTLWSPPTTTPPPHRHLSTPHSSPAVKVWGVCPIVTGAGQAFRQSHETMRPVNLRGGLWVCLSLGRTPGLKLKADVFGVHSLSYYCSIVIYKSVWDMEISHATQDLGWVKAHCETGPSTLWEGLICKLMLSFHLARAIYSMFSSFQHVIFSKQQWTTTSSLADGKNMPAIRVFYWGEVFFQRWVTNGTYPLYKRYRLLWSETQKHVRALSGFPLILLADV